MNTTTAVPEALDFGVMEVQLLGEDDLQQITGGGPWATGCLLALGGVGAVAAGVVVGIAVYAIVNG